MKKYFDKVWKKVFLIIGIALISFSLFNIITAETVIKEQFLEYGPEVETDIFDATGEFAGDVEDKVNNELESSGEDSGIVSDVSDSTGLSPDLTKMLLVLGIGVIVILVFSELVEGSSGGSDKKKK